MKKIFSVLLTIFIMGTFLQSLLAVKDKYLKTSLEAEVWIKQNSYSNRNGTYWSINTKSPQELNLGLYSGNPGIILFYLELFHNTADKKFLKQARRGADYLLANIENEKQPGFYSGIAGIAFVLEQVYKYTREEKYRSGLIRCILYLKKYYSKFENSVKAGFDIISGSAGTGLFLLQINKSLNNLEIKALAIKIGKTLLKNGIYAKGGKKWPYFPNAKRQMPNFSHGTAGIAYYFSVLYQETGDKKFLNASLEGAGYIIALSKQNSNEFLTHHHNPGGEKLYYLGWCHGPVGTARLFYNLFEITKEKKWLDLVHKGARAIINSGIPWKQTPGFWNNISRCCGTAGVAEFFLDLYRITKKGEYLKISIKMTDHLISKADDTKKTKKWTQAEHRTKPDLLIAQLGLMQGSSGIGLWLLKLHAHLNGRSETVIFPDTPFK